MKIKRDSTGSLTAAEKEWLAVQKSGMLLVQQSYDRSGINKRAMPLVDEDGYPMYAAVEAAKRLINGKNIANTKMSDLLGSHNISLDPNDKLTFTIDFYDNISVSGIADTDKADLIAQVLNSNEAGRWLIQNIFNSCLSIPTQYTGNEKLKYKTDCLLRDYTGYSLNDLVLKSDGLYTKDGEDIRSIFNKAVDNDTKIDEQYKTELKIFFNSQLNQLNKIGINNIKNLSVTIDYTHGQLTDVGTEFGFGYNQTSWIDKMMSLRGNMAEMAKFSSHLFGLDNSVSSNSFDMSI